MVHTNTRILWIFFHVEIVLCVRVCGTIITKLLKDELLHFFSRSYTRIRRTSLLMFVLVGDKKNEHKVNSRLNVITQKQEQRKC